MLLVFSPRDVAGVVVAQQDRPLLFRLPDAVDLVGASVDDPRALGPPAERIGSRVQRVVQDLHDGVVDGRLPDDLGDVDVPPDDGHLDLRSPEPEEDLPRAAEFAEFGEHHADGFLHVLVGIGLDLARLAPAEAGRKHEPELASPRLRVAAAKPRCRIRLSSYSDIVPFRPSSKRSLTIRGSYAPSGSIDERPRQRAKVDQVMPVPPIARQSRRFDAIDGADVARAHHRHQPLEAGTFDAFPIPTGRDRRRSPSPT